MNRRNGSVFILAIWVLFFLTMLAVAVGSQVGGLLRLAGFVRDHVTLQAIGQAVAMQCASVISGQTNTWDGVADQSWTRMPEAFTVEGIHGGTGYAGFYHRNDPSTVIFPGIISESGRINLNRANERLLAAFFQVAGGMSSVDAADLALAVWTQVRGQTPTGGVPQEGIPFVMVEELRRLPGVTPELYERVAPDLTVFGDGLININTASAVVLESLALAVMREARYAPVAASLAQRIVRFRADGHVFISRDGESMRSTFYSVQDVPNEEQQCFERMRGRLSVASTHFRGITYVLLDGASSATPVQEFVFDNRHKRFVYWREL